MNKIIMTPLSDIKVKQALGPGTKILKYSELKNYETIHEILPSVGSFCILLLEDDFNSGHWCAIMKTKDGIFYYNSYGKKYDTDLAVIPMCIRKILGEDKKEIGRLLDGEMCTWNKIKMQGERSQVCGRFCILVITMVCMMNYSPADCMDFLTEKKDLFGGYDRMVATFVPI
jgi:hypothetical protein